MMCDFRLLCEYMSTRRLTFIIFVILATTSFAQWARAPLKIPAQRDPNLYRADADAQQEIGQTIGEAGRERKRVLLVFGAAWCGDCYALDYGFHQPRIAPLL